MARLSAINHILEREVMMFTIKIYRNNNWALAITMPGIQQVLTSGCHDRSLFLTGYLKGRYLSDRRHSNLPNEELLRAYKAGPPTFIDMDRKLLVS